MGAMTTMEAIRVDAIPELTFDSKSQRWRYRDSRKFAPMAAVRSQANKYLTRQKDALVRAGRRYSDGKIDLPTFQREAAEHLKGIHLAQAITALGKQSDLSPEIFLEVGRQLKKQYYAGRDWETGGKYGLKHLAQDIKDGKVSPAQLTNRLTMYADSGKKSYWGVRHILAKRSGYTEAKRSLSIAEHCPECLKYAGFGWVGINDVIPIGERCSCRGNCKCSIEYR